MDIPPDLTILVGRLFFCRVILVTSNSRASQTHALITTIAKFPLVVYRIHTSTSMRYPRLGTLFVLLSTTLAVFAHKELKTPEEIEVQRSLQAAAYHVSPLSIFEI